MASVTIRLNSIGEVKEFNRIAATVPGDVDLHSGRYCVEEVLFLLKPVLMQLPLTLLP